jgi:ribosome-associated protein
MADDHAPWEERPPSKSQLKRDAHALQKLGAALVDIPENDWLTLQLPEALMSALRDAKRMPSRGARKRQLQYIGKLMREIDPEPVRRYFDDLRNEARRQTRRHQEAENWRERMIGEGDSAIDAWLLEHPDADRQHLRRLVRQARKERDADETPKSSRALFRYIRDSARP